MHLVQTFKADFCILQLLSKSDERTDGSAQLSYNISQRHHHTQSHLSVNYGFRSYKGYHNVGSLVKKDRSRLLYLSQCKSFYTNLKQPHLNTLPLPPFLFLTIVQFDLLHSCYYLDQITLLARCLCKSPDIEFTPILHKQ